jgi:hypothetical protein
MSQSVMEKILKKENEMPFKSKAQQRKMFSLEEQGKLKKGTAEEWAKETPDIKKLPNKVKKRKK